MLNSDGDPLGQDASLDSLVDDDADGVLRHVEDATGLAVVRLVGHALLEGAVALQNKENGLEHAINANLRFSENFNH